MPVVLTSMARINDWAALQQLHQETFMERARAAGATRYRIFRNVNDASEILVLAELPDYDAAQEMGQALGEQIVTLLERAWEPTGWEEIG